jgi:hypothetical protein
MNSKRREIAKLITAASELTGGKISAEALQMFVDELEGLSLEIVRRALHRCARELRMEFGQTLTLRDVLDRCGVLTPEQELAAAADVAWTKVLDCFYQCGDCPEQHLSQTKRDKLEREGGDRLRHAIRVVGGWGRITETRPEHYSFLKRDFTAAYMTFDVAKQVERAQLTGTTGFKELVAAKGMR